VPYPAKRFVYIIRSVSEPERRYVGVTADPAVRLAAHNAGQNRSTSAWRPWFVDVCVEFRTELVAMRFERFLKSGSGQAFARRHFV
jgi:predicted GIY-YIG superfamily endonuclease